MNTPASASASEELIKKIQELETGHANLKEELSQLKLSRGSSHRSHSVSPQRSRARKGFFDATSSWKHGSTSFRHSSPLQRESRTKEPLGAGAVNFTHKQYLNMLQSNGQSVHIFDLNGKIIYWNEMAALLYGYSSSEALGHDALELLTDSRDFDAATSIIHRTTMGESWTGQFPVKNKLGKRFLAMATNTPFYDDDGSLVGVICLLSGSQSFQVLSPGTSVSGFTQTRSNPADPCLDTLQPFQVAITTKISNFASMMTNKVRAKMRHTVKTPEHEDGSGDSQYSDQDLPDAVSSDHKEEPTTSGASTPGGDLSPSLFPEYSQGLPEEKSPWNLFQDSSDGKSGIHKIITSKTDAWIGKKGKLWPWKVNEKDVPDAINNHCDWPTPYHDQEIPSSILTSSDCGAKAEMLVGEYNWVDNNDASGSWSSSFNVNSTSSVSSSGSTNSSAVYKSDTETDSLDCEILWEDLIVGEQIGQGSCGTVYHGLWYGSDVAIKVFSKQEYTDDVIRSFKQEVSLMKRLRHPNVLLFMGVVTSPERLCIVTEFLPRGSLLRLLQKNISRLDWRRRVNIALDIARGMNYLHRCKPPVIHRDLKSSNLLVDKNWTVKVGDFGLSRLKHEMYLTKAGKGTPQWMAPEVLRNEPSDEKSDVYSYGIILWELVTEKIPWENHNSMQVMGAVGFMNQRLDIPKDLDPQWVSIIESCWHSKPECRPTFQEILEKFKGLQRQCTVQAQATRSSQGDMTL